MFGFAQLHLAMTLLPTSRHRPAPPISSVEASDLYGDLADRCHPFRNTLKIPLPTPALRLGRRIEHAIGDPARLSTARRLCKWPDTQRLALVRVELGERRRKRGGPVTIEPCEEQAQE